MNSNETPSERSISSLLEDDELIDAALLRAVRNALREHKRAGASIVEWRQRWRDHFTVRGVLILGRTAIGRATVELLPTRC
ncbi:MAG: hypothetical protein AMXMBFR13_47060 [Phycisphaerae bacterium]|jgi:hypothetical protein